jgi:hypothetical protein
VILPGERVVLCETMLTDKTDLAGWQKLVEQASAQITGCAVMIDRSTAPWPHPWPLEFLVRPDVPLVSAPDCEQCRDGLPLTPAKDTVLL